MYKSRDIEAQIRDDWFPEHKATYTEHGDLNVLTWKKEGAICYYVRYVFDGGRMYVSGDLGEAVFCFTEKADVHIQSQYSLDYFISKLQAYHGATKDFDSEKAVARLREWLKELKENEVTYDHDQMRDFFDEARSCSSTQEWAWIINKSDFLGEIEIDFWEWMYGVGDVTPLRMQSYLIGLKMAAEQLINAEKATA